MSSITPRHIYQHPSGYIFRYRVPHTIKDRLGQCEFRYSLRTGSLRVATQRAKKLSCFIDDLTTTLNQTTSMPTRTEIQAHVRGYIQKMLDKNLEERAAGVHYTQQFKDRNDEIMYPPEEDALTETLEQYDQELGTGKYKRSSQDVDNLLNALSMHLSKHSHDYKRFCQEMCIQMIEAGKAEIKRNHRDFSDVAKQPVAQLPLQKEEQGPSLSEVISLYFEANTHLAPKTIDEYRAVYRVLQKILGSLQFPPILGPPLKVESASKN